MNDKDATWKKNFTFAKDGEELETVSALFSLSLY